MGGDHLTAEERALWKLAGLQQHSHANAIKLSRIGRDYIEPVYLAPCHQDHELATGPRFAWPPRVVRRDHGERPKADQQPYSLEDPPEA